MTTALVILDMLEDFLDGRLANPAAHPIVEHIDALARAARAAGWPVIYATDAHQQGDFELAVFGEHAMVGTPGARVIAPLAPGERDLIVPMRYYSAFTQTDPDATCRVLDVRRLVIAGQHTDRCVRHTSYDAFLRGIDVTIAADATAVFQPLSEEPVELRQQRALDYLRTFYGAEITQARDVIRKL